MKRTGLGSSLDFFRPICYCFFKLTWHIKFLVLSTQTPIKKKREPSGCGVLTCALGTQEADKRIRGLRPASAAVHTDLRGKTLPQGRRRNKELLGLLVL